MPQTVGVLIVDDHAMVSQALRVAFEQAAGLEVVGCAESVSAAVEIAKQRAPDVVVLDYNLPGEDALGALDTLRAVVQDVRVLFVSGRAPEAVVARAIAAGCAGYLLKDGSLSGLVDAVHRVSRGEVVFSPGLLEKALSHMARSRVGNALTDRELGILQLLADGLSADAISKRMFLSVNTVRNHIQNVLTKLGTHSRLEAVAEARRLGIVSDG